MCGLKKINIYFLHYAGPSLQTVDLVYREKIVGKSGIALRKQLPDDSVRQ